MCCLRAEFFRGFGNLAAVWIARNPPGFGFVTFEDARDAADAVKELNGKELRGRPITVEVSGDKKGGGGGGGGGGRSPGRGRGGR